MIKPPVSSLMEKVDGKYTLVVATAKRARQISAGAKRMTGHSSEKPVTIAIYEINEGKINYTRTRNGIK